MSGKNKRYGGFLFAEILTALTVLGILFVGLALSLNGFAKANRRQLVKQRCIAAAQAELDGITVTGKPIPAEDFNRLWPKLDVSIGTSKGIGQWEEMELVEVTAAGSSFRKQVKVKLSRYILGAPALHSDAKGDSITEGGR